MNFYKFKKKIYIGIAVAVILALYAVIVSPSSNPDIEDVLMQSVASAENNDLQNVFSSNSVSTAEMELYDAAYEYARNEENFEESFREYVEENYSRFGLSELPDLEVVLKYYDTLLNGFYANTISEIENEILEISDDDQTDQEIDEEDVNETAGSEETSGEEKIISATEKQMMELIESEVAAVEEENAYMAASTYSSRAVLSKPDDIPEALEQHSTKQFAKDLGLKILKLSYDIGSQIAKYAGYIIMFSNLFDVGVQLFDFLIISFPQFITGPYDSGGVLANVGITLDFISYLSLSLFVIALLFNEFINRIKQQKNEHKREQYMKIFIGVLAALFIIQLTDILVIAYEYFTQGLLQMIENQLAVNGIDGFSSFFEYTLLQTSYIGPEADRSKTIIDVVNGGSIGAIYEVESRGDNLIASTLGSTLIYTLATFDYIYSILGAAITDGGSILGAFFGLVGSAAMLPAFVAVSAISIVVGVDISEISNAVNGNAFLFNPLTLTIGLIISTLVMLRIAVNLIKFIFELSLIYIFLPIAAFSFVYSDGKMFIGLLKRFIGILLTIVLMIVIMLIGLSISFLLPDMLINSGIIEDSITFNLIVYIFSLLLISNTANISEKLVGLLGLDGGMQEHQTMLSNPFIWMSVFNRK